MKISKVKAGLFTVGTAAVVTLCVGVSPALAGESRSVDAIDLVPVLAATQKPTDTAAASKVGKSIAEHLDKASVRVIAVDDRATYSAARDLSGREVCLLVQTTGPEQATTGTCIATEKFVHRGLSAMASGADPASRVVAHLLPSDVDTSGLPKAAASSASGPVQLVRPEASAQLVLQETIEHLPNSITLPIRDVSSTFTLVKFPD